MGIDDRSMSRLHPEARDLAMALADRFGFSYQPNELWRPHGNDTGIHEAGVALDLPIDQNSEHGRRMAAIIRGLGYYVYDKPHGSGPHLHIEVNRNPDGSPRKGFR